MPLPQDPQQLDEA